MRKISLLLSASLFLSACGGENGGITDPVIKTCSGSISPSSQVTISAGQTTSVKLSFSNCSSVTVSSDNDVKYQSGVNVAPDTTLQLWPSKVTVYTFVGNGEGAQPTVRLTVNVIGKPELTIDNSAIPDSGVVLNTTVMLPLHKQYISSCSAPVFNGTPTTADPKTVKAVASISGETLVYSPGSTMPVLVNGKRQATITVSCLGQDNSFVTASIIVKLVVPTLVCSGLTPNTGPLNWGGNVLLTCTGNSLVSSNGVDFGGTVMSNSADWPYPPDKFITNPTNFHDPEHYGFGVGIIGDPMTEPYTVYLWFKNSERAEAPLRFSMSFK
ncbi:MAG: hypothetical protein AAB351_02090 [Patescibacteria group bacterium]